MKNKIVSADEAIAIIRDGDTVACSGFVGSGTPDELIGGARAALHADRRRRAISHWCSLPRPGTARSVGSIGSPDDGLGKARGRRPLGTRAEAVGDGGRRPYRGLQPAARHIDSTVSRHRGAHGPVRSPRWDCVPSSIPAQQGGKINDAHHGRSGARDDRSTARNGCSTRPSRSRSR